MPGIVLFVLPFVAGILGAHFLLYYTVVHFFSVGSSAARLLVFFVPFALTMSIVIAIALLMTHRNTATQIIVHAEMIWIGFFINLLMAIAGVWLFRLLFNVAGLQVDMRAVCFAGLAAALLLTAWGMFNAISPKITEETVLINNLPDAWRGKKIVHLSDVHLGPIRQVPYLEKVVAMVDEIDPDLILITGDLFDGMSGNLDRFVSPLSKLHAKRGVYFATGNHEGYLKLTAPLTAIRKTHIRILDNEVESIDGLQIVGVSFPEHDKKDDSKEALRLGKMIDKDMPSILMFHTPTDVSVSADDRGQQQNKTYFAPNIDFTFAKANGIDLQLSGHTHQGQFFPFTLLTHFIFKGYDYGLHVNGDFHIYVTSGTGTWGPPMRTHSKSEIAVIKLFPKK